MARILSLDYGERKLGLALGDTDEGFVVTKRALARADDRSLLEALEQLVVGERIDELLVGVPRTLSGGESAQTARTLRFISLLEERLDVPVRRADERLTTRQARRAGVEDDDSAAAAYLLEAELERRRGVA